MKEKDVPIKLPEHEDYFWSSAMTFDEYLDFLDQYWEMFGPPPPIKIKPPFKITLL